MSGSPARIPVTFTVSASPPPTSGLVAAYGFEEASGTTVLDSSGNGNAGTITGATRITTGKSGRALSFNGSGNNVMVPDSPSLRLTNGMTLEAWVYPTTLGTIWRTVIFKEQPGELIYALYANTNGKRPDAVAYLTSEVESTGTASLAANTWTHLAATYDGATLRLFVNGTQVASKAAPGSMPAVAGGPLRLGGNSVWGEWFAGRLDDVRVYNRALTAAQIGADMAAGVS